MTQPEPTPPPPVTPEALRPPEPPVETPAEPPGPPGGDGGGGGAGHRGPAGPQPRWARNWERANLVLLVLSALATTVFAVRYYADGSVHHGHTQRSGWPPLVVSAVLFALFLSAAVLRPFLRTARRCALMAVAATVVFCVGTVAVWQVVAKDKVLDTMVGTPLTSQGQTQKYLDKKLPGVKLRQLPTGLFIQGAKFSDPQEVEVNGYVWQRYEPGVPETSKGVTFPEAPDGYEMTEVYKTKTTEGQELRGWHFNLTLRQHFSYAKYPLDKQNIWLRMWTVSAFENEVLVPDFASYPPWRYDTLGLDQDIVSTGWSPYYTGYSYGEHDYTMTYGVTPYTGKFLSAPELYFNVGIARSYAGPLTGKLLQSFFISAIMFLALFVYTKDDRRNPRFGFSTWTAISFAVSLLLVVVVDQTQIREIAGDTSLTYMEFFAISQYIVIMGIFANAIIIGSEAKIPALEWRDNLLPTILYWPVLIGLFFAFTVGVFAT
ncbi:hypothetical protein ABT160_06295 [Streptomyces sp. NPDC001941]|uniref:hypothetical protein n=1 Tax=Streptomyces sp. NPDC001941 TaxID=3154659 RepID=UPI003325CFCE